eukprot:jgi/Bigna1/83875/fgenesh1_pg.117_\
MGKQTKGEEFCLNFWAEMKTFELLPVLFPRDYFRCIYVITIPGNLIFNLSVLRDAEGRYEWRVGCGYEGLGCLCFVFQKLQLLSRGFPRESREIIKWMPYPESFQRLESREFPEIRAHRRAYDRAGARAYNYGCKHTCSKMSSSQEVAQDAGPSSSATFNTRMLPNASSSSSSYSSELFNLKVMRFPQPFLKTGSCVVSSGVEEDSPQMALHKPGNTYLDNGALSNALRLVAERKKVYLGEDFWLCDNKYPG